MALCKQDSIIRIILDTDFNIEFSSIGVEDAINIIKEYNIKKNISQYKINQYIFEDNEIIIDFIDNSGIHMYLITISKLKNKYNVNNLIDTSTGLYSRNYWEKVIMSENESPFKENFILTIIDIDDLKKINDKYGHLVGDQVINIVSTAIKNNIENGIGIRYGGDEMVLIQSANDFSPETILKIKEEIRKASKNYDFIIDISSGSCYCKNLKYIKETFCSADKKLYIEKNKKKFYKTIHI